ncbi:hypothetical protein CASFOL_021711 [Castilleja foliolosa]|uniref:Jacalin-type lectin domain-containing protein n=1 Tax=Castilleja foliolosa TaxID=1961234 RepID=A0ABD3CYW9_9LAMI
MSDDSSIIKIGPAGKENGEIWDEKGNNKIAQIFICHDSNNIYSIQFQYLKNGALIMSKRHGKQSIGFKFDVVKLNYSTEYITWISGFTFSNYVASITFGTNLGQYGPFGMLTSTRYCCEFKFHVADQFDGFHGSANIYGVLSIGVYLKPTTTVVANVKSE